MRIYLATSVLVGRLDVLLPVPLRLLKSLLVLRFQQLQELLALLGTGSFLVMFTHLFCFLPSGETLGV